MSLYGYKPKTKKAPWFIATQKSKPSPNSAASRQSKSSRRRSISASSKFFVRQRKPIARRSNKMAARIQAYNRQRLVFLEKYPICECCKSKAAVQVHHRKGRGKYLLDESTWTAICAACHTFVHAHPTWAYLNGLLLKRV